MMATTGYRNTSVVCKKGSAARGVVVCHRGRKGEERHMSSEHVLTLALDFGGHM